MVHKMGTRLKRMPMGFFYFMGQFLSTILSTLKDISLQVRYTVQILVKTQQNCYLTINYFVTYRQFCSLQYCKFTQSKWITEPVCLTGCALLYYVHMHSIDLIKARRRSTCLYPNVEGKTLVYLLLLHKQETFQVIFSTNIIISWHQFNFKIESLNLITVWKEIDLQSIKDFCFSKICFTIITLMGDKKNLLPHVLFYPVANRYSKLWNKLTFRST